ncbi:aldehyde dehydrogenase family protein [Geodermatophilus sp. SYSU D00742]
MAVIADPATAPRTGRVAPVRGGWVAGREVGGAEVVDVVHPWSGDVVGCVRVPTAADVERAVAGAGAAAPELAAWPAHRRADALRHVGARLLERAEEVAGTITAESGKPLRWARVEVQRAAATFRWAAEEALRWSGELQRLDADPASDGRLAVTRRFPRGPVLGITPFNFPLNLVAHKVAPALAAGAPIVLKPAPKTPLSAALLGELLAECTLPEGAWSVLPLPDSRAGELTGDPRLPVVSFTGSGPVGWWLKETLPRKHVTLELGGNAAALVCADWDRGDDLARAAARVALFANHQAGQSCISVQRVFVERPLYERFLEHLVEEVGRLRTGDPGDERTDVGPLIDLAAAERVEDWVSRAVAAGARLLTGGGRSGTTVPPAVLVDVPPDSPVACDEVFGPVVVVAPVDDVADGLRRIEDSRFGLQAGVFTHDLGTAFRAQRELTVGGVVVGDVPTYRAEQMPYGGVKESGIGREGVRSAMEDYTEPRVLVLSGVAL